MTLYNPKIFCLIPAFEEEKTVFNVVKKSRKYSNKVIVIDDGSTDKTVNKARAAGAIILNHQHNEGQGRAIITGFEYALRNKADIVVILDADGQHDPKDIPKLLEPIISGEAMFVSGSRFLGSCKGISKIKLAGIRFFTLIVQLMGYKITDLTCGFRALTVDAVSKLELKEAQYCGAEIIMQALKKGIIVVEVPVDIKGRIDGNSRKNIFRHFFQIIIIILRTIIEA